MKHALFEFIPKQNLQSDFLFDQLIWIFDVALDGSWWNSNFYCTNFAFFLFLFLLEIYWNFLTK